MQISKATLILLTAFIFAFGGVLGYLANTLNVNQDRAQLNAEIVELENEVERLELQLQAEEFEEEQGDNSSD